MTPFLSRSVRSAAASVFAASLAVVIGCGTGGPEEYAVTGQVTYDGKPVPEGRITFRMISGDGRAFSGPITNGAYELKAEPGDMAVEIIASRLIPGKFDTSNPGVKEPIGEMYIPKQYNAETTLKATVVAGSNTFPFELTSKK